MVKDLICSNTYYKALAAAPLLKVRIPKTGLAGYFRIKWGLVYVCLFVYLGVRILLLDAAQEMDGQGSHLQQYLLQGVGRCPAFKSPHSKDRPGRMFSNSVGLGAQ